MRRQSRGGMIVDVVVVVKEEEGVPSQELSGTKLASNSGITIISALVPSHDQCSSTNMIIEAMANDYSACTHRTEEISPEFLIASAVAR